MATVALDLRSTTKAGTPNDPSPGLGLFADQGQLWLGPWQWRIDLELREYWAAPLFIDPLRYDDLGSDPLARMRLAARNDLADRLELSRAALPDSNLGDILAHYVLGSLADPTGVNGVKPLRMGREGLKLRLGEFGLVVDEPFSRNDPNYDAALAVRWADYRQAKAEDVPLEGLRRWTGYDMLQLYGRVGDDLLPALVPPEHLGDGWERPRTTILDNFDRANQSGLGTSSEAWSWAASVGTFDIDTNQAKSSTMVSNRASVRADSALSSDDHYSQVDYSAEAGTGTFRFVGPRARFNSAANTGYIAQANINEQTVQLNKVIAGTYTFDLGTSPAVTFTLPATVKLTTDASALALALGGVEKDTATDTDITGYLYAGLEGFRTGQFGDNFEAADLAAADPEGSLVGGKLLGGGLLMKGVLVG